MPDDRHEVLLTITVRANVEEDYLGFLVEVQQAGIFFVKNADPALSQVVGSHVRLRCSLMRVKASITYCERRLSPNPACAGQFRSTLCSGRAERQQQQNAAQRLQRISRMMIYAC